MNSSLIESKRIVTKLISDAKHIVFLTGAGLSLTSGIDTFRTANGNSKTWMGYDLGYLSSKEGFAFDTSVVWQYYHHRRNVVLSSKPSKGHLAISKFAMNCIEKGKSVHVLTQNIDELHQKSGFENVIELHGNIFALKRWGEIGTIEKPGKIWKDYRQPLVPAFEGLSENVFLISNAFLCTLLCN
jgi:NAD-dependent deacetylase sirtuin 5